MNLGLVVYLIVVVPKLSELFTGLAVASTILTGCAFLALAVWKLEVYGEEEKRVDGYIKKLPKLLFIPPLLFFIAALIPSERTMYTMVVASGLEKLVANEQVQQLGSDGVDVLKELLQKAKRELAEDKKER